MRGQDPGMMLAEVSHADDARRATGFMRVPPSFPRPAVLALLLGLDEVEQALDLRAEMAVRFEDLGGVPARHLGAVDQPVGLVQRLDPRGADAVALQADDVDAADLRRIAVDEHEPRDVVDDPRLAADEAVAADRHEVVDCHAARDVRVRLDVDVPAQERVIGDGDPVAEHAVVRDVGVGHQEVVGAEPGHAVFLLGAAVDR